MVKFTPGPWTAYEFGKGSNLWYIGSKLHDTGPMFTIDGFPGDRKANAELIAQAPEMYEALQTVIDEEWLKDSPLEGVIKEILNKISD